MSWTAPIGEEAAAIGGRRRPQGSLRHQDLDEAHVGEDALAHEELDAKDGESGVVVVERDEPRLAKDVALPRRLAVEANVESVGVADDALADAIGPEVEAVVLDPMGRRVEEALVQEAERDRTCGCIHDHARS